jgi:PIN domain nuclease of toxin-antitoxin system
MWETRASGGAKRSRRWRCDRAPIAQAMIEDLALVTTDGMIRRYAGERLRVIR